MILIPLEIANRKDIKNTSKLIYGYLFYQYENKINYSTIAQIAIDLNFSKQTIIKCLKNLEEDNLIEVIRDELKNNYEFKKVNKGFTLSGNKATMKVLGKVNKGFTKEDDLVNPRGVTKLVNKGFTKEDKVDQRELVNKGFTNYKEAINSLLVEYGLSETTEEALYNKFNERQILRVFALLKESLDKNLIEKRNALNFISMCILTTKLDNLIYEEKATN